MAGIEIMRNVQPAGRVPRNPQHTFQIRHRPWQIQPMLIAPVLPGETLKNLLLQARVVTDPIRNPLIGWWYEFYFFYVKHRDLAERAIVTEMHLNPAQDMSSLNQAATLNTYHAGPGVDWVKLCLARVTEEYFRDDDEEATTFAVDGLPLSKLALKETWMDSLKDEAAIPGTGNDHELPGQNPVIPDGVPAGFENHFIQWEHMRALKLTDASFEDYLRSFGVNAPRETLIEEINRPELIRYVRDWTYPSNTIDPVSGAPSSACSWGIAERADKDRFFKEPGFIFGVAVARPKVYVNKQKGAGVSMMNDAYSWLPAILQDQPYTSLKKFAFNAGPLSGTMAAGNYWVDLRDLLVYGDQFVNFALTEIDAGFVALPTAAMQRKYVTAADMDGLFKSASPANKVRADGVVSMTIHSRIVDTSM